MNLPPIPPNCPYFGENKVGTPCFWMYQEEEGSKDASIVLLQEAGVLVRPIIAAVARCAWIHEADRIQREDEGYSEGANDYGVSTGGAMMIMTCRENAEAWAKWGKQGGQDGKS